MIPQVQAALDAVVGSVVTLNNAVGAGRSFELFVMSEIALGLVRAGFRVWLQRSDGTRIGPTDTSRIFVQRGGAPAGISPASSGPNNASTICFQWRRSRPEWEIWNGVQIVGRSGAAHELDVAIVPKSVGDALRVAGGRAIGRPRVAIECKDVLASGSIDETRAFIARLYDLTLLRAHHSHMPFLPGPRAIYPGSPAGPKHRSVLTYWQENRRTKNIIARRTGFVWGMRLLARYHRIEPHSNITVGNAAVGRLVTSVEGWALKNAR